MEPSGLIHDNRGKDVNTMHDLLSTTMEVTLSIPINRFYDQYRFDYDPLLPCNDEPYWPGFLRLDDAGDDGYYNNNRALMIVVNNNNS